MNYTAFTALEASFVITVVAFLPVRHFSSRTSFMAGKLPAAYQFSMVWVST
jgi:hypothetical protein